MQCEALRISLNSLNRDPYEPYEFVFLREMGIT